MGKFYTVRHFYFWCLQLACSAHIASVVDRLFISNRDANDAYYCIGITQWLLFRCLLLI